MTGHAAPLPAELRAALSRWAADAGFDAVGVASTKTSTRDASALRRFIASGWHGDMAWMATTADRRIGPNALWPEARSAVMLGLSYAPGDDPLAVLAHRERGAISVYAQRRDYHDVVKSGLRQVARRIAAATDADVKVFVDTAPLMEKPLAARAGLGWQGKHTNLVSRAHGSWLFLGAILTTAEIPPDRPETDHCGSCRRCLDVCPTDAFPAPYQLDARRCLAYLTIEHRGHIPQEFREPMGNRVFGCDDCLAVCPWNKFAAVARDVRLELREETRNPPLADLLALDDPSFRTRFAGTPVKRTGRDRLVRNALIAAGNARDPALIPAVERLTDDPSVLIRAMAAWALGRLLAPLDFARVRDRQLESETDPDVKREWLDVGGSA